MTGESLTEQAQQAANLIRQARHFVALTGAGISTPSGIPDFRSAGSGLWTRSDPMQVASLSAFRYRPQAFFDWLRPLATTMLQAQPNPAHDSLAWMEQHGYLKAIATQNIDDLHQRAGSKEVIPVHGTLDRVVCLQCQYDYPAHDFLSSLVKTGEMPICERCGAVLKPGIVLFEEMLPMNAWQNAEQHFEQADLILVAGTSLEVMPASQLPLYGLNNGARLIINTRSETYLDEQAEILIREDLSLALPAIQSALQAKS